MMIDVDRTGRFKLDPYFLLQYKHADVPWGFGALSWFTYRRTYSRAGEKWYQTCQRVIEGMFTAFQWHCLTALVPFDESKAQYMAQEAYRRMFCFKWLPPGRGLWMMGSEFVWQDGAGGLFNCAFVSTSRMETDGAKPFVWAFQMLMLGVGVGFDCEGAGIDLPPKSPLQGIEYTIPDTREGWTEVAREIIEARLHSKPVPTFDYSRIRPKGAPIKRFGGTASGPDPLKQMEQHMHIAFDRACAKGGKVTSELICDLFNIIGRCVVSGNVRRSAEIALGRHDDAGFLGLKDYSLAQKPGESMDDALARGARPWMWTSNNSVVVRDGDNPDYMAIGQRIANNGEPGFFWVDNARNYGRMLDGRQPGIDARVMGVNPCGEISLESYEKCNLVETFPAHHFNLADYQVTLKLAYLYSKIVTCLPTHSDETNAVIRANRRIGCSMSGVVQAIDKWGVNQFKKMCDTSYQFVQQLDKEYSAWLGIPRSIKTTTVKPSGTTSILAGATPGCHDAHSPFTIRRVRVSETNPLWEHARDCGYHVEDDHYAPATKVISFPTRTDRVQEGKADVSMWRQMARADLLQTYWADNQVSATLTFSEAEKSEIGPLLSYYADRCKGVSMLPLDVSEYPQLPYEAMTEQQYHDMVAKCDPERLMKMDDVAHDREEKFCDGEACEI